MNLCYTSLIKLMLIKGQNILWRMKIIFIIAFNMLSYLDYDAESVNEDHIKVAQYEMVTHYAAKLETN